MVKFTSNGGKVSSKQFFERIKRKLIAKAEDEIERRLKSLRDPETGKPVKFTKQRRNGKTTWNIEGSPQVKKAADKIIGAG